MAPLWIRRHLTDMAAERQRLQEALCSYTSDTLAYFATVRDFYERSSDWMLGRERELKMIKDIEERADKEKKEESKHEKREEELASVLKKTLGGLEKLSCFLDALEKMAVTSLYVFMENQVLHLPEGISLDDVQKVIKAARRVCPLFLEFKRDANAFFLPKLQNVEALSYQLDKYIQTTQIICKKLEKSSFSEFDPKIKMEIVVELDVDLSEGDVQRMFSHIDQLIKIRMNQDFRMVFLFQEEPCAGFISEFNERKPRMLQFLEELEGNAVQLDTMNKGAKISSVVGSSVGAVGGVVSIIGLALTPFTSGVSLGLIIGGAVMGVTRGVNSLVTTATKFGVNRKHQQKASEVLQSFMDDVQALQDCLKEVTQSETNWKDVAVGVGKELLKAGDRCQFTDVLSKNTDKIENLGKAVAQNSEALQNVAKMASDVPDISQILKEPLVLSNVARGGLFAANALLIGMDIYYIYKDSSSLAKGSETEVSQFIRARAALLSSEMDSWQKIHDSLSKGLLMSEKNKDDLERSFYPEMKKKKQREAEMKIPSDEVDKKIEKAEVLNAAVTNSLADWLLVPLFFVITLLFILFLF